MRHARVRPTRRPGEYLVLCWRCGNRLGHLSLWELRLRAGLVEAAPGEWQLSARARRDGARARRPLVLGNGDRIMPEPVGPSLPLHTLPVTARCPACGWLSVVTTAALEPSAEPGAKGGRTASRLSA